MIFQVFNLSDSAKFKDFSSVYKIYREVFDSGLLGLEMRNLSSEPAEEIFKIILEENEICYKKQPDDTQSDLFIPGTMHQLKNFAKRVISSGNEDIGYRILNSLNNFEDYNRIRYTIGRREFLFNRAHIMGILNVTPDSFSDGGLFLSTDQAVRHGLDMIEMGADIIDIGGESTRPGSDPVKAEDEISRVVPVIEEILKKLPDTVISVDTNKSEVAAKALEAGALIVNDISGLSFDPGIINVVKKYNAAVIIMHIKGTPKNMQENPVYDDVIKEVFDFLKEQSAFASKQGVKNIIIDPGIGFGKTPDHNFQLIKRLEDFKSMGYPILAGISRKSFIGKLLDLKIDERDEATAVAETAAVLNGARIIRTHNVKFGKFVTGITEKLL